MKIHNPFRIALVATLGVGLGLLLIGSIQTLSTILLYVGTALFLSLGLEPVVAFLERRKLPRWVAVLITILGVLALFAGIILMRRPDHRRPDQSSSSSAITERRQERDDRSRTSRTGSAASSRTSTSTTCSPTSRTGSPNLD